MAILPLSCTNRDDPVGAAFFCFAAVAPPKMKIVAVATTRTRLEFMRINIDTLLHYRRIYPRLASLKTRQLCNGSLPQTSLLFTCFAGRCVQNDTKAQRRARYGWGLSPTRWASVCPVGIVPSGKNSPTTSPGSAER